MMTDLRFAFRQLLKSPGFSAARDPHPRPRHRAEHRDLQPGQRSLPPRPPVPGTGARRPSVHQTEGRRNLRKPALRAALHAITATDRQIFDGFAAENGLPSLSPVWANRCCSRAFAPPPIISMSSACNRSWGAIFSPRKKKAPMSRSSRKNSGAAGWAAIRGDRSQHHARRRRAHHRRRAAEHACVMVRPERQRSLDDETISSPGSLTNG